MFKPRVSLRAPPKYDSLKQARKQGQAARITAQQRNRMDASYQRALALHRGKVPSEYKHVDVNQGAALTQAGQSVVYCVNSNQTGTGFFNRVGNRINPVWVNADITLVNLAAVPVRCRCMLVWDLQPSGALPVISEIIQDIDATGNTGTTIASGRNTNNSMRFRTLMDKLILMNPAGVSDSTVLIREIRFLRGLQQAFRASSENPSVADIATGALYVVLFSDISGASSVTYLVNTRFRYTDP